MKITTTLQLLRTKNMYAPRYEHLLKSLGAGWPDKRPINLLQILDLSRARFALWALRAAREPERDRIARLIAADCAETVIHIFATECPGNKRPQNAITVSRQFAMGEATSAQLCTARIAARDAASVWSASSAVYEAGYAAYDAAAENATDGAAFAAWHSVMADTKYAARGCANYGAREIVQKEARVASWVKIAAIIREHLG